MVTALPTLYTNDGAPNVTTSVTEIFTFSGSSGLDMTTKRGAAKVVYSTGSCATDNPAGGTVEETDVKIASDGSSGTARFDFGVAATYKMCYKVDGGTFTQVGANFVVDAVQPPNLVREWKLYTGVPQVFTFNGGSGLNMAPNQDAVKVVDGTGSCADAAVTGMEVTDLEPGDGMDLRSLSIAFAFTKIGTYKMCYKLAGLNYAQVSTVLTVEAVAPTTFQSDGALATGVPETFTLAGGSGMRLGAGQDTAKVVLAEVSCAATPGSGTTIEITDLGPDDADDAQSATATLQFTQDGTYKWCYKVDGIPSQTRSYTPVMNPVTFTVGAQPPTDMKSQNVSLSMANLTTANTTAIQLNAGVRLNLGLTQDAAKVVLSTESCAAVPANGTSEIIDLDPGDSNEADSATVSWDIAIAGSYKVCYKLAGGVYSQVGTELATVYGVLPVSFAHGSITTSGSHTFDILGGSGLNLAAGRDAAKIVFATGSCNDAAAGGSAVGTDLGPDDRQNATSATVQFSFTLADTYMLCYKSFMGDRLLGSNYTRIGTITIDVAATPPTSFATSSKVATGSTAVFVFSGGTGMKLGPGQDQAKMVFASGSCTNNAASGGSVPVTDLGPSDSITATSANASFTFSYSGTYMMCYKLHGKGWSTVGTQTISVAAWGFRL